jgi:integrase
MTPFLRGSIHYVYVPVQSGGVVERTTGARDGATARKINRLVKDLSDKHRWTLLRAITDKPPRLTLRRLYAAFVNDPTLRTLEADLATPDVVPLIDEFLKDRDTRLGVRKSGPRSEYVLAIKRFIGAKCPASRLTPQAIDEWLTKQPGSSTYRRDALLRLSSFCRYLVRRRVIPTNPVRDVEKPQRQKAPLVYENTETDQKISEQAVDERYAALFALIHGSGADVSAALVMCVRDLHLTARDDGWGLAHVPGTKTDKRDRHEVRIEPWATVILRDYIKSWHLFPAALLFEGITRYMAAWHHKAAAEAAGVPGYTLRHARHSWAVRARLSRGETWEEIGQQLGTSPYVVSQVYAAFKPREFQVPSERQEATQ